MSHFQVTLCPRLLLLWLDELRLLAADHRQPQVGVLLGPWAELLGTWRQPSGIRLLLGWQAKLHRLLS